MVDDSINNANAVEAFYKEDTNLNEDVYTFIQAARSGNMDAPSPFSVCKGTIADMMQLSLAAPRKSGGVVSINEVFRLLGQLSKDDDEAFEMLEKMAQQFIWVAK